MNPSEFSSSMLFPPRSQCADAKILHLLRHDILAFPISIASLPSPVGINHCHGDSDTNGPNFLLCCELIPEFSHHRTDNYLEFSALCDHKLRGDGPSEKQNGPVIPKLVQFLMGHPELSDQALHKSEINCKMHQPLVASLPKRDGMLFVNTESNSVGMAFINI